MDARTDQAHQQRSVFAFLYHVTVYRSAANIPNNGAGSLGQYGGMLDFTMDGEVQKHRKQLVVSWKTSSPPRWWPAAITPSAAIAPDAASGWRVGLA